MDLLPEEVVSQLLQYLDGRSSLALSATCRKWNTQLSSFWISLGAPQGAAKRGRFLTERAESLRHVNWAPRPVDLSSATLRREAADAAAAAGSSASFSLRLPSGSPETAALELQGPCRELPSFEGSTAGVFAGGDVLTQWGGCSRAGGVQAGLYYLDTVALPVDVEAALQRVASIKARETIPGPQQRRQPRYADVASLAGSVGAGSGAPGEAEAAMADSATDPLAGAAAGDFESDEPCLRSSCRNPAHTARTLHSVGCDDLTAGTAPAASGEIGLEAAHSHEGTALDLSVEAAAILTAAAASPARSHAQLSSYMRWRPVALAATSAPEPIARHAAAAVSLTMPAAWAAQASANSRVARAGSGYLHGQEHHASSGASYVAAGSASSTHLGASRLSGAELRH